MIGGLRVQFGSFEADLSAGELFHKNKRLVIQEKPFAILALLLHAPQQLVARQEIIAKVWPDVFVENDLSLNTAIHRLRTVLAKADPRADLIETVGRRGYRLRVTAKFPVASAAEVAPVDSTLRLAVLPFSNLNAETRDHFSEGLTAQMIVQLGHAYKRISVISPITSLYFANTAKSLPHIADRLRADYVLLGTALRASPQLRITARLIRTADQCCVWSEGYLRHDGDIFAVQDEITRSIAHSLLQTLPEPMLARAHTTTSPEIYRTYLKARLFSYKFVQSSFKKATELFERVIEEDPDFAPAYGALAQMLTAAVTYGGPPHLWFYERINALANQALEFCEEIADAHAALGWLHLWHMRCAEGERSFQRAAEINPSNPLPYIGLGHVYSTIRRHEEAVAAGQRACELDPLSPLTHAMLGWHFYNAGRFDQALTCEQTAIEIDSSFCPGHAMLGFLYHELGDLPQAVRALRCAVQHGPDTPLMSAFLARELAAAGETGEATKMLQDLLELRKTNCLPATSIAFIYDALGQPEQAWIWLHKAVRELDPWRFGFVVDPRYKGFWKDSRFPGLLREAGFSLPSSMPSLQDRDRSHGPPAAVRH
jgi:TolB-like protein/tetratricopeptide (TPR) repeat protein